MHDLIEQMGWEIVRQESIKDPGRRSRLRNPEDVYTVLKNNTGTNLVEGIMLDLSHTRDLRLNVDTFKKMPYLRFLKFYTSQCRRSSNVYVPTTLESFSDELRYLAWSGYPLKSLPSTFCAEKLVELHMSDSQVSKLWDGAQDLVNLKKIILSGCKQLVELPDFTKASNLTMIIIVCCERLCRFHPSILSIHALEILNLNGCKELKSLKGEIRLKSLKRLDVWCCSSLEEFSVWSEELSWLNLMHSRIKSLPNELCFLIALEELWLYGCEQLIELPHNIKALSRLKILSLGNCQSLRSLPELPPSILSLDATNCISLGTTFSLKALFSINRMFISFKNCMRLDEHSLYDIMQVAYPMMVRATIGNELTRIAHLSKMSCNGKNHYPRVEGKVCYPGSKVPEWFRYQTRQASITVELDQPYQLLGFFACCVSSRVRSIKWPAGINWRCYLGDGERDIYRSEYWQNARVGGWNSDHVHIWYEPYDCDSILEGIKKHRANDHCTTYIPKISFEFTIEQFNGRKVEVRPEKEEKMEGNFKFAETSEHDSLVQGCGIFPIYVSDILNFIQKVELELEFDDKSKKYQDIDELDLILDALKSEMILKIKEEPVP